MPNEQLKHERFFRLYNSIQMRLYTYLLTVVHNRVDAEDLLQETAIFLWEKFDQFEEGTSFGAWAIRIAQYKALEFIRRNKKTRMVFDDDFYEKVSLCSPQSSSDVSEREEALRSCIKKLPEKYKTLLAMRYKKSIPIKRISNLMGRSANGLYQTFSKIISSLRSCMESYLAQQL